MCRIDEPGITAEVLESPPDIFGFGTGNDGGQVALEGGAPLAEADKPKDGVGVVCLDSAGKPVKGAEVHLFQHPGGGPDSRYKHFGPLTTDADGKVLFSQAVFSNSLGNFDRWLYARVPGKLVGVGRSARWTNTAHVINPEAQVKMVPSRTVEGKVRVPDGFDATTVKVSVRAMHVATGEGDLAVVSRPGK